MIKIYLFLFLSSIVSLSHANYLDDWTDEDLCRWMDAALIPEHISEEIYTRKTICLNDSKAIELTTQATHISENGTIFPSHIQIPATSFLLLIGNNVNVLGACSL